MLIVKYSICVIAYCMLGEQDVIQVGSQVRSRKTKDIADFGASDDLIMRRIVVECDDSRQKSDDVCCCFSTFWWNRKPNGIETSGAREFSILPDNSF